MTVTFSEWLTKVDPTGTEIEVTGAELTGLGVAGKKTLYGYAVLRKTNTADSSFGTHDSITFDVATGSFYVDDDAVSGDQVMMKPIRCLDLADVGMDAGFTWTAPADTIAMGIQFLLLDSDGTPNKPGDAPGVTFSETSAITGNTAASTSYNNGAMDPTWTVFLFSGCVISRAGGSLTATDFDFENDPAHASGNSLSDEENFDGEFVFQSGASYAVDTFTGKTDWAFDGDAADGDGGAGLIVFNLIRQLAEEPPITYATETIDLRLLKVNAPELPYMLHSRMLDA